MDSLAGKPVLTQMFLTVPFSILNAKSTWICSIVQWFYRLTMNKLQQKVFLQKSFPQGHPNIIIKIHSNPQWGTMIFVYFLFYCLWNTKAEDFAHFQNSSNGVRFVLYDRAWLPKKLSFSKLFHRKTNLSCASSCCS